MNLMTHKGSRLAGMIVLFFVGAVISVVLFRRAEQAALSEWLEATAIPVVSLAPEFPNSDLNRLRASFCNAKIIGLGEATHGSREFFLMKHRLVRYLVEEMDFTVFALEASMASCAVVNDYIHNGKGSLENAVQALDLWMWKTEEVQDMIEWMRRHNSKQPDEKKLSFVGFDMQTHDESYSRLFEFYKQIAQERLTALAIWLREFRAIELDFRYVRQSYSKAQYEQLSDAINEELEFLDAHQERLLTKTSRRALKEAKLRLQTMKQFLKLASAMLDSPENAMVAGVCARDAAMAENIDFISRELYPNQKMIIWSHNGHIGNGEITGAPSMGSLLKARYGDAYYAMGFDFKQGEFQARNNVHKTLQPFTITSTLNLESALLDFSKVHYENFIIDFHAPQKNFFVQHWFQEQHCIHQIGGVFNESEPDETWFKAVTFGETFDGLIFLSNSTPTHLLASD